MDVRNSDIVDLKEKVKKHSFKKYLIRIRLQNVRSFSDQEVKFDFPITALIGTNGGGKSTILGAAALAYRDVKPGKFFPKSNVSDNSMANWKIEYSILDRTVKNNSINQRTAKFVSAKWIRDNVAEREVVILPIQRTVPANEQTRFKKFIGLNQRKDVLISNVEPTVSERVGRILGKDASNYKRISLKGSPSQAILSGLRVSNEYSQFHFGAGEASIIEMVSQIENASDGALVLIEEIENGLHPLATQKMVEYLFDVVKRKKVQVIFTTHSEYALKLLPPEAIWASIDGTAYQGKLNVESLRALTGATNKEHAIFVEDDFAKDLCEEMIRQFGSDLLHVLEIHKAGGFPYVVDVLDHHNKNPTIKGKAVAVIDGDNPPDHDQNEYVIRLPGGVPEALVFGFVKENAAIVAGKIQQRCHCPQIQQDKIVRYITDVSLDTTDNHLYFSKLGDKLDYISEIVVRRALCSIYVEHNEDDVKPIIEQIRKRLNL